MLHRQELQKKAGHHQATRKHNPDAVAAAPGRQKIWPGTSNDRFQLGRASTSARGQMHELSGSGRKTMARTQGGSRRGSGRDHAF
jgi:hypothetical protein